MFISKFHQLSAHAAKRIVEAPNFTWRIPYLPTVHDHYVETLRRESFCTEAAKLDSEEGSEAKQKINVTFMGKDGEEINIKVPVGMSTLEAALDKNIVTRIRESTVVYGYVPLDTMLIPKYTLVSQSLRAAKCIQKVYSTPDKCNLSVPLHGFIG
ncbi:uncharacterized protein [Primulina eburnea]|uniref:uncharacterized protein isoform X2 n=1 Tax=Primulina eburnea TaxID=1245227 RepID=UPI003C6C428A